MNASILLVTNLMSIAKHNCNQFYNNMRSKYTSTVAKHFCFNGFCLHMTLASSHKF